MILMITRINNM